MSCNYHQAWTWMCFPACSSHILPHRYTQWLHLARALTAAPTTAAAVALQALTISAKPTSTSEACPLPPQTMTWSSSVSREYYISFHHYLLLINYWFFDLHVFRVKFKFPVAVTSSLQLGKLYFGCHCNTNAIMIQYVLRCHYLCKSVVKLALYLHIQNLFQVLTELPHSIPYINN